MSNNQFKSVKVERFYTSLRARYVLPQQTVGYVPLVSSKNFVIKRDPDLTRVDTKYFSQSTSPQSTSVRSNGSFAISNGRDLSDPVILTLNVL